MNTETVDWSINDQNAGYALPARYFYDEHVFNQEKSKIFFKSWHLVAHINE